MASPVSNLIPDPMPERRLTREEGFDLLESMFGTFHDLYEKCGGVEAVIRDIYGEDDEPAQKVIVPR